MDQLEGRLVGSLLHWACVLPVDIVAVEVSDLGEILHRKRGQKGALVKAMLTSDREIVDLEGYSVLTSAIFSSFAAKFGCLWRFAQWWEGREVREGEVEKAKAKHVAPRLLIDQISCL